MREMDVKASNQITIMKVTDSDIAVGGRNLIRNSIDMIYPDYYFTQEIVVTSDGDGNLTWVSPDATMSSDDNGNVTLAANRDGDGNVILSLTEEGEITSEYT